MLTCDRSMSTAAQIGGILGRHARRPLDLPRWLASLDSNGVDTLDVQRAHIELYARWSEEHGLARVE
jgi:hypothetical protein